ncbi:MAG: hypothetical protein U9N57_05865 [Pseudomonadota bacterium]|nr:hypothetical protein [Pseudomonadota bacterium]
MQYVNNFEKNKTSSTVTALIMATVGAVTGTYSTLATSMDNLSGNMAKEELNIFKDTEKNSSTFSETIQNIELSRTGSAPKQQHRVLIENELEFVDEALKIITGLDFISVDPEKEAKIDAYFASKKPKTKVLHHLKRH